MKLLRIAAILLLGALLDAALLAIAIFSASAQISLLILLLGVALAVGLLCFRAWRLIGAGMVAAAAAYLIFLVTYYLFFCSSCGE